MGQSPATAIRTVATGVTPMQPPRPGRSFFHSKWRCSQHIQLHSEELQAKRKWKNCCLLPLLAGCNNALHVRAQEKKRSYGHGWAGNQGMRKRNKEFEATHLPHAYTLVNSEQWWTVNRDEQWTEKLLLLCYAARLPHALAGPRRGKLAKLTDLPLVNSL